MRLPIVVAEGPFCIMFFTSVEGACSLEPIDVAEGLYRAWDSEGRPIDLLVEQGPRRWFCAGRRRTVLRCDESKSRQPDELRSLLLNFLLAIGITGKEDAPLEDILTVAMKHGDVKTF